MSAMIGKSYEESAIQGKAYRLLRFHVRDVLEEFNITPTEWAVMGLLLSRNELSQSDIGEYLSVEAPLVTNIVSTMEKKNLLFKKGSPTDARRKIITLTDTTKKEIPRIEKRVQEAMYDIFSELGEQKMKIYFEVLEHIIKKIER